MSCTSAAGPGLTPQRAPLGAGVRWSGLVPRLVPVPRSQLSASSLLAAESRAETWQFGIHCRRPARLPSLHQNRVRPRSCSWSGAGLASGPPADGAGSVVDTGEGRWAGEPLHWPRGALEARGCLQQSAAAGSRGPALAPQTLTPATDLASIPAGCWTSAR